MAVQSRRWTQSGNGLFLPFRMSQITIRFIAVFRVQCACDLPNIDIVNIIYATHTYARRRPRHCQIGGDRKWYVNARVAVNNKYWRVPCGMLSQRARAGGICAGSSQSHCVRGIEAASHTRIKCTVANVIEQHLTRVRLNVQF